MKRWKMACVVLGIVLIGIVSWKKNQDHRSAEMAEQKISYYTCAMHPQIHQDKPGNCPICGMRLIPVYQTSPDQPSADHPLLSKERAGERSVTISPERQQLIGIKTEIVTKKTAVKEIRTVGRVAFDPELAVAEQEFIDIAKNVPSLKEAAVSRLHLMGVSDEEISALQKKAKDNTIWIYATLFEGEMDLVTPGTRAIVTISGSEQRVEGVVKGLEPVVNAMTRSVRARIEVPGGETWLHPNRYVDVVMNIDLGEALVIPKSSVIDTGTRRVAFVMRDDQTFESREIKTGAELGDEVVVSAGLEAGEKVVSRATFLVDSESQLKAAVSGGSSQPTCPEGQAWDTGMAMCMPKIGQ